MSFLSKLFRVGTAGSGQAAGDSPARPARSDRTTWRRILVPAVGGHFSRRGLEVACRLAQTSGATLQLVFVLEVPRSLVIDAAVPDSEALAGSVLKDGEDIAREFHVTVVSTVYRARNAAEGILKLVKEAECDLLVLGARPDETRGLPRELTKQLFTTAPCEVIVDYIAGEQ